MSGIMAQPAAAQAGQQWIRILRRRLYGYRYFLLLVILPTLLVSAYYYLIAANQYESQADYIVRRSDSSPVGNGFGQILGLNFSGTATSAESYLVEDYLLSHDAIERLRREDNLVTRFRNPSADFVSRLWFADPTPESLLKYFRRHVTIEQDLDSGISHLRVHAFSPDDAYRINRKLLSMGEERINQLNERTFRDQVQTAANELAQAEGGLLDLQRRLTTFRRSSGDIDPEGSGKAQIGLVSALTGNLVAARSRLIAIESAIGRDNPQYRALAAQVRAMEAQVGNQSSRMAGSGRSIATKLGSYEELIVRREQATRVYVATAARYEQVRAEASHKQLYLIRVVDANLPVKSLFPERGKLVLTVLCSLLIAYAIGWLLVAGVKEHSI